MTDLRAKILAVQLTHMCDSYDQDMGQCPCGFKFSTLSELAAHVTDAVIAELGRRTCQRCRIAVPLDGFPLPHDGSDVMRPFCWSCTNYVEWATS